MGFRDLVIKQDSVFEYTFAPDGTLVSTAYTNTINNDFIDVIVDLTNQDVQIRKFNHIIDASSFECTTSIKEKGPLSYETFTSSESSNQSTWDGIFSIKSWHCLLWDSDRNDIGQRNIYIENDYSLIDTEFKNNVNSQFECLRFVNDVTLKEYGSLKRFRDYCKFYDLERKIKMSTGGIIIDDNQDIDHHKNKAEKFKIK